MSEKRSPFGGSNTPVLRAVGQAGQLSGGGESVVVQRAWQCADRLAAVLAGGVGQGSAAAEKNGCARGAEVSTQAANRAGTDSRGQSRGRCHRHCAGGCGVWQRNGVA